MWCFHSTNRTWSKDSSCKLFIFPGSLKYVDIFKETMRKFNGLDNRSKNYYIHISFCQDDSINISGFRWWFVISPFLNIFCSLNVERIGPLNRYLFFFISWIHFLFRKEDLHSFIWTEWRKAEYGHRRNEERGRGTQLLDISRYTAPYK